MQRRRGDRAGQQAQPGAAACGEWREPLLQQREELVPRRDALAVAQRARAIGIPQLEHRCLAEHVGRAAARRVRRIALDLRRPAHVRLDEHADAVAVVRQHRRVEHRLAVGLLRRAVDVGDDRLERACVAQPAVASASEAPMSFMKSRRFSIEAASTACTGGALSRSTRLRLRLRRCCARSARVQARRRCPALAPRRRPAAFSRSSSPYRWHVEQSVSSRVERSA